MTDDAAQFDLAPGDVAERHFPSAFRGLDPGEVRTFLREVAARLESLTANEADLRRRLDEATERLDHPHFDENVLLSALGEETTSVLRSARAAAADVRAKAEAHAHEALMRANDEAATLRAAAVAEAERIGHQAEHLLALRTAEAEEAAAEIVAQAEMVAGQARSEAETAAGDIREGAESLAHAVVQEAEEVRDRVLADLARKRSRFQEQIELLRTGRARLLEAYRVVQGTLVDVTAALERSQSSGDVAAVVGEAAARLANARQLAGPDEPETYEPLLPWATAAGPDGPAALGAFPGHTGAATPTDGATVEAAGTTRPFRHFRLADAPEVLAEERRLASLKVVLQPSAVPPRPEVEFAVVEPPDPGEAVRVVTDVDAESGPVAAPAEPPPAASPLAGPVADVVASDPVEPALVIAGAPSADGEAPEAPDSEEPGAAAEEVGPPPGPATDMVAASVPDDVAPGPGEPRRSDVPAEDAGEGEPQLRPGPPAGAGPEPPEPPPPPVPPLATFPALPVMAPLSAAPGVTDSEQPGGVGDEAQPATGAPAQKQGDWASEVDELFARIRAGRARAVESAKETLAAADGSETPAPDEGEQSPRADHAGTGSTTPSEAPAGDAAPPGTNAPGDGDEDERRRMEPASAAASAPPQPGPVEPVEPVDSRPRPASEPPVTATHEAALQARDASVGPLETLLARRLKRALQDEQNAVLHRLRGQAHPSAKEVLGDEEALHRPFGSVVAPILGEAHRAGAAAAADPGRAPRPVRVDDLVVDVATAIVRSLRPKLLAALDEAQGSALTDDPELIRRIGSAFREWRGHQVAALAGDAVAAAYARGAYLAFPAAVILRWVVDDGGEPCPDCEDNALAGAVAKGDTFPTGQRHPPAHSGCRCILVREAREGPADADAARDTGSDV